MLSERDDDLALLDVMIEALAKIAHYVDGVPESDFLESTLLQDAVALNLLVVGECANHLSGGTKAMASDAPWPRIISLRNRIAHRYHRVDRLTIFGLAIDDAAELAAVLVRIRSGLEPG